MSRRGTGVLFCLMGTLFLCTRYLAAAIFGSGVASWDAGLFQAMLSYVGPVLMPVGALCWVAGIAYLIWGEVAEAAKKK